MFISQFRYLVAIADERHFGRAAERCKVTQPSLSNGIKQLELEFGAPIVLRRTGQRFQGLTAEGERMVTWSRAILAYFDEMKKELAIMRNQLVGQLRIGAMPTISPVLPFLLQSMRNEYPHVRIDVQFIGNEAMKRALNNFSLDVGLTHLKNTDIREKGVIPLFTEQLSLLVPETAEYSWRETITWSDAARLPLALLHPSTDERRFIDSVFQRCGHQPVARVESELIAHLMFQVQLAELCTIIPSYFSQVPGLYPGTRALRLIDPVVRQEVGLFWTPGDVVLPMANAFVVLTRRLITAGGLRKHLNEHSARLEISPADMRQDSANKQ